MNTKKLAVNATAFLIYSFGGAITEHLSYFAASIINPNSPKKALSNPIMTGFPLYGIGAYIAISMGNFLRNLGANSNNLIGLILYFISLAAILSLLEYIVGSIVNAGETSYTNNGLVESWDYSGKKYSIAGTVSLRHFISWGLLGLVVVKIHPHLIERLDKFYN